MTNPSFGILSYLVGLAGVSDSDGVQPVISAITSFWSMSGSTRPSSCAVAGGVASLPQQPFEAAA